jgi:hypothetical protein
MLIPVEIKSGKTVNSEFFKNIQYWMSISGFSKGYVVYGEVIISQGVLALMSLPGPVL